MPKATFLTEFLATKEQFELTERARWQHYKANVSQETHVRFPNIGKPEVRFELEPKPEPSSPYVECWYVKATLPELAGTEPLDFLVVKTKEDQWFFSAVLGLFFRAEEVEDDK